MRGRHRPLGLDVLSGRLARRGALASAPAPSARGGLKTIVLGEFACSVKQPNATSRILWYDTLYRGAIQAGIAPIIWDDNGWVRTLDRKTMTWDNDVLRVLQLLRERRDLVLRVVKLSLKWGTSQANEQLQG